MDRDILYVTKKIQKIGAPPLEVMVQDIWQALNPAFQSHPWGTKGIADAMIRGAVKLDDADQPE